MVSQHRPVQPIPDIAEQQTGREQEGHIIIPAAVLTNIMAIIGLVLLAAATLATRGVSTSMVTPSSTMSTTRTAVCDLLLQSQSNNLFFKQIATLRNRNGFLYQKSSINIIHSGSKKAKFL